MADTDQAAGESADGLTATVDQQSESIFAADPEMAADTEESRAARTTASVQRDALATYDREIAMQLLEKSLQSTDWSYKAKSSSDREIGHASYIQMEKAFIHAASGDREGASKLYEKYAGRPPTEALLKRVEALEKIDFTKNINDLTAGLSNIEAKRGQNQLQNSKSTLEERIRRSHKEMGDVARRASDHRSRAMREYGSLLGADDRKRDPFEEEKGFFLFSAVARGMRAGKEWAHSVHHEALFSRMKREKKDAHKEHGEIVKQIAGVSVEAKQKPDPVTVGRGAEIASTFKDGIAKIVARAAALAPARTVPAVGAAPEAARSKGLTPAEIARRTAVQGQGIGIGS